jgi:hypothetical protein
VKGLKKNKMRRSHLTCYEPKKKKKKKKKGEKEEVLI